MFRWLKFFAELCMLKVAPQEAPTSQFVSYASIFAYFVLGTVITSYTQSFGASAVISTIQVILIIFLTNIILWVRKTPERYTQAITSIMGSGTLIGLVALPVLSMMSTSGAQESFISILWVALIVWETAVLGHILRHTMDMPFIAGFGAALIYMYMSFAITLRILKVITVPLT